MRFAFNVGDADPSRVEFDRDPWIGTLRITADGEQLDLVDPTRLSTHFDFKWLKRYTFVVGQGDRHEITIEHERPVVLGGLLPNTYRVFMDGQMTQVYRGY
jgi:hypothetical protein